MAKERFNASNAALLLIDHQSGVISWARSTPEAQIKQNAIILAKTAKILKLPVVITSSMEEYLQGPMLPEFQQILPDAYANRVKRLGIVNAMEDDNFAAAVKATGRKKIVIAGVTNDVCTVFPVMTLLDQGFDVQVVADAGGSPTQIAEDVSLRRMERAGATLTSTNQIVAELVGSWATPEGGEAVQLVIGSLMGG